MKLPFFFFGFLRVPPGGIPDGGSSPATLPRRHDGDDAKSVNSARNPVCGSSTSDIPAIGGHAHACYRAHGLSQLRRSRPGSGSLDRVGCESLSVRGCAPGRTHRSPSTWRSVDMFGRARAQCSGARRRRDSDPQRQTALDRVPAGRGIRGGRCGAAGRTVALHGNQHSARPRLDPASRQKQQWARQKRLRWNQSAGVPRRGCGPR